MQLAHVRFVPIADIHDLFDDIVGAGKKRWRHSDAEHLSRLKEGCTESGPAVEYRDRYSVLTKGPANGPLTQGGEHVGSKFLTAAMLSLALSASAYAQAPQAEKNVSMKMALMIIEGALEQCTKDGYKVSVVIVDKAGSVAASVRGDGTNPHTLEFGRLKAYTARTRSQTSLEFKNLTDKPENAYLKQIPNVVAVGGGVPIKAGTEVIGAVGVSGAPGGEKDEVCANAGIAKVADSLK